MPFAEPYLFGFGIGLADLSFEGSEFDLIIVVDSVTVILDFQEN